MALNMDKVLAKQAELNTKVGKVPYMKLKSGNNVVRILPPFGARELPWVEFAVAFNVGPIGKQKTFTPRAQFGHQDCPLQKKIDELIAIGDEASKKEAARLRPKNKFHMFVISRADEAAGPLELALPPKVLADVLTIMADPDFGDITHPDTGIDICISYTPATGKSFPEYHVAPKRHSSPLIGDPALREEWLGCDYFEKYKLGRPADADYIQACLDGRVDEYIAAKKGGEIPPDLGDNEEGEEAAAHAAHTAAAQGQQTFANVAAAAPPAIGMTQTALPTVQSPFAKEALFWLPVNGQAVQVGLEKINELVLAGQNPQIMDVKANPPVWTTATDAGFKLVRPTPPIPAAPPALPTPPAPPALPTVPAAPPPPPVAPAASTVPFDVPGDEASALANTLAEFQLQRSQVSNDLMASLGK
ncbi:MAG: hypothetical protein E6R03_03795 [Hyphomicrobiaceae bacterium]|nr:MAG: hypothetical protein E6R03_03795 [Hyphomicrobiaceae bacterium]